MDEGDAAGSEAAARRLGRYGRGAKRGACPCRAQTPLAPRARIFLSWVVGRSRTARGRGTPLTPPPDLRSLAARTGRQSDRAHVGPVGLDRIWIGERRRGAAARGGGVRSGYLYILLNPTPALSPVDRSSATERRKSAGARRWGAPAARSSRAPLVPRQENPGPRR